MQDFNKARMLLYKYYPKALHLFHPLQIFHPLQREVDMEIVAQYLGAVEKPIRFVPVDLLPTRKAKKKEASI
jgi:hypothetical protein